MAWLCQGQDRGRPQSPPPFVLACRRPKLFVHAVGTPNSKAANPPVFVRPDPAAPFQVLPLKHRSEVNGPFPVSEEPSDHVILAAEYKIDRPVAAEA